MVSREHVYSQDAGTPPQGQSSSRASISANRSSAAISLQRGDLYREGSGDIESRDQGSPGGGGAQGLVAS